MLTQEEIVEIHVLHHQGMGIRAIARELGISRNTVRHYLRHPERQATYRQRLPGASKLDAFKPYLKERIDAAHPHWIPATVLCREIQAMGYQGKEGIVRNYIRPFKKTAQEEPVVRFETPPGKQMQVDFTTIRRGKQSIKAFVATLGYSRATYVRFSEKEQQNDWLSGIAGACQFFGGVPQEILFDNAKSIILERDAYGEGKHRWNPQLLAQAKDYGYKLRVCRPYRAKTKGKVERFNHYLKNSYILPLATTLKQNGLDLDVDLCNAKIGAWLHDIAHQRIHGTTQEKPQVRLEEERHYLLPLPTHIEQALPDSTAKGKTPETITPIESIQHDLQSYDALLEVTT
jgi:transposase